jgi:hypothetical protein
VLRRPFNFARLLTAVAVLGVCAVGLATASATPRPSAGPSVLQPLGHAEAHRSTAGPALLQYWGGAVMRTSTTYAIFWLPSGTSLSFGGNNSGYEQAVSQFLGDVAHDSGTRANVFGLDTQYYDTLSGGQTRIAYNSTLGGAVVATDPLPAQQCNDGTTYCVTDAQLQAEIQSVVSAHGWPQDTSHAYFVFTPQGLGSCLSGGTSHCAYSSYCAYHNAFAGKSGSGTIAYGAEPWLYGAAGCDMGQYPNGGQADPTINVLSHELSEAITDPVPSYGWLDASGAEIGDKCAWTFGTLSGATKAQYNETINGRHYFLQEEFDNASDACQQRAAAAAPVIASLSPGSGKDGAQVTINGSGLTGATTVKFNGASASFSVTSDAQIKATVPAGATSGTLTVTTSAGSAVTSAAFLVLPTVSSFTPTKAKAGASVVISGSGFTGATSVTFNKTVTKSFTVNSDGTITVAVPAGASSGAITVTTPSGSAASSTSFTVQS